MSGYGRVLVPVHCRLNVDEIGYILEHSGASVLLGDPEVDAPLRRFRIRHRFVLGAGTCLRARAPVQHVNRRIST